MAADVNQQHFTDLFLSLSRSATVEWNEERKKASTCQLLSFSLSLSLSRAHARGHILSLGRRLIICFSVVHALLSYRNEYYITPYLFSSVLSDGRKVSIVGKR